MPTPPTKERLDTLLVARGLASSRDAAKRLVMAGKVRVDDQPAPKPGQRYPVAVRVETLEPAEPYVGRGGRKLRHALDHFGIDPAGAIALDVGASTGGFTDCLLQAGAAQVYALDAGHGQLDWNLRNDPRVIVLEKTNARYLTVEHVPEPVDIVTIDVSFISVAKLLDAVLARLRRGAPRPGRLIVLVKPQFEAGPAEVGKGGIVRDERVQERVVRELAHAIAQRGLRVDGVIESPIRGADGNREFLLAATAPSE